MPAAMPELLSYGENRLDMVILSIGLLRAGLRPVLTSCSKTTTLARYAIIGGQRQPDDLAMLWPSA